MGTWSDAKERRASFNGGWYCETCGRELSRRTAIGHHVKYRRNGGSNSWQNCQIRCSDCETSDRHTGGRNGHLLDSGNHRQRERQRPSDHPARKKQKRRERQLGNVRNAPVRQSELLVPVDIHPEGLGVHHIKLRLDDRHNLSIVLHLEVQECD